MAQVKTALLAGITAIAVAMVGWVLNAQFITGFLSGWWICSWF